MRQILFENFSNTEEYSTSRAKHRIIVFELEDISNIPRPPDIDGEDDDFLIPKMSKREIRMSKRKKHRKPKSITERRIEHRKKMQQLRRKEEIELLKYLEARNLPLKPHEKQILKLEETRKQCGKTRKKYEKIKCRGRIIIW